MIRPFACRSRRSRLTSKNLRCRASADMTAARRGALPRPPCAARHHCFVVREVAAPRGGALND
eukprot:4114819-Prymnesium_polylepis.1